MKIRFKTWLLSLVAIVLLLGICMMPAANLITASADSGDDGPTPQQDEIYYFSDWDNSNQFANYLRANTNANVHHYSRASLNNDDIETSEEYYGYIYSQGDFSDIEDDSFVIFEIRERFSVRCISNGAQTFTQLLKNIFSDLKDNNCQIMFICGTDEAFFRTENAFLDFVDIHINLDKLGTFFSNILYRAAKDLGDKKIGNCTFLLDNSIAPEFGLDNRNCDFVANYLVRFLKWAYRSEIQSGPKKVVEIMEDYNIHILCQEAGTTYYDIVAGISVNFSEDNFNYTDYTDYIDYYITNMEHVYAIGATWQSTSSAHDWIQFVTDIRTDYDVSFDIYVFNSENYNFAEYNQEDVYLAGALDNARLFRMAKEFVLGADMHPYDNWSGECDITHKLLNFGQGGWMNDLEAMGEEWVFESTQLYMDDDDWDYYTSTDNVW